MHINNTEGFIAREKLSEDFYSQNMSLATAFSVCLILSAQRVATIIHTKEIHSNDTNCVKGPQEKLTIFFLVDQLFFYGAGYFLYNSVGQISRWQLTYDAIS